jgi:hypothetical protein
LLQLIQLDERSLVIEVEATFDSGVTLGDAYRMGLRLEAAIYDAVPVVRAVRWCPITRSLITGWIADTTFYFCPIFKVRSWRS